MALFEPLFLGLISCVKINLKNCCRATSVYKFCMLSTWVDLFISIHLQWFFFVVSNHTRANISNFTNGLNWAPVFRLKTEAQDANEEQEKNTIKCKQARKGKNGAWIADRFCDLRRVRVCEFAMTPRSNSNASIFNRIQLANIRFKYVYKKNQNRPSRIKYSTASERS